jgi:radical SAM protein with 4Fe4S-binding SPASM domain
LAHLEKVARWCDPLPWLLFAGGEVYLDDALVDTSAVFYKNARPAVMTYPTNGLEPELIRDKTEAILKRAPEAVIVVKLSLDGIGQRHDMLRSSPGNFQKVMRTYELLGELKNIYPHLEIGVNSVFMSSNQYAMKGLIDYVRNLDRVGGHTVAMIRGTGVDPTLKAVDLAHYVDMSAYLAKRVNLGRSQGYGFAGAALKPALDAFQRRLIAETLARRKRLTACYAGRRSLVLRADGRLYPCEIRSACLGNIRELDGDFERVLKTPRSRALLRRIRAGDCFCSHECQVMISILSNPGLYPHLLAQYVRGLVGSGRREHGLPRSDQN